MPITPEYNGVSKTLRPDAISFDYQYCFTLGPQHLADITAGVLNRPWRVRNAGNNVYVARSNDGNTDWDVETLLFSYTGSSFLEIDSAFDQQGNILVCGERDGHIWIFFYDPTITAYNLVDIGPGRNPRAIMDSPLNLSVSDILVFYVNDAVDAICYRAQRDRYATEYHTPVTGVANTYVEDATRLNGYRIEILYSVHDTTAGTYTLGRLQSTLYPVPVIEEFTAASLIQSGILLDLVLVANMYDVEGVQPAVSIRTGVLGASLIDYIVYSADSFKAVAAITSGFFNGLLLHSLYDVDSWQPRTSITSGTMPVVVVPHSLYDVDSWQPKATIQSGILA